MLQTSCSSSSTTSCSPPPRRSPQFCPVCAGPSTGLYFGVLSCRACASFYRRSVLERRQYLCRRDGDCALNKNGMRNSCRSCRLRRCTDAGMSLTNQTRLASDTSIESRQYSIMKPRKEEINDKIILIDQQKLHIGMSVDLQCPNTEKFSQSLRNIESGIKAIVNVLNSGSDFLVNDQKPQLITYEKLMQIDRGSIMLHLALVREHFPAYDTLSVENKVSIMRSFGMQLHFFRCAELTLRAFPNLFELNVLVLHWGCMIDKAKLEHFFSTVNSGSIQERIRLCEPIWRIWHTFILDRFRPLEINQTETSALIGIMFWNCVERALPRLPSASGDPSAAHRNSLFVELHSLVAQRCCAKNGQQNATAADIAIRIGQLHLLLQEAAAMTWQLEETIMMFKVFLPPLYHCWDYLADFLGGGEKLPKMDEKKKMEQILGGK